LHFAAVVSFLPFVYAGIIRSEFAQVYSDNRFER
jgi:hypothetical protein